MSAIVALDGVTKSFSGGQRPAVAAMTGAIAGGQVTGVIGPDGAGKTTLIRLMAGLLAPDAGRITVAGADSLKEAALVHASVGYMPQRFGLYEDLSVIENLILYARLQSVYGAAREEAFAQLLRFTGLGPFTGRLAQALSGGMKQKLGLACALIRKPRLLLLDEPSVGVDPVSRRELWRMVRELADEGIAVVWSTAYLDEAERCDRVLLLNGGELLFSGPPEELTRRVEGRSYRLDGLGHERRRVLNRVLAREGVIDGVIQGRFVRLVMAEGVAPPNATDLVESAERFTDLRLEPVQPRFEDAFVDILGGGPGGRSVLAEAMSPVAGEDGIVVRAEHLTRRFGTFTAASDISFEIRRGEIFGLLGPNGAGKSTTFKMLCGLLQPSEGRARVAGLDLRTASSQARARIGYMAQKFSLYGTLSVGQNLAFFAGVYGLSGRSRRRIIQRMVEAFGLEPYLGAAADGIPLGFKQRLALACAVMHEPAVLFLDEPTAGVDPITRREFWTHINALVEKGVTVMVTTHFMDEAEYCDRVALIYRGSTIATAAPDELEARVRTAECPSPTLEDAFVALVQAHDAERQEHVA